MNTYGYVSANPLLYIDPYGLEMSAAAAWGLRGLGGVSLAVPIPGARPFGIGLIAMTMTGDTPVEKDEGTIEGSGTGSCPDPENNNCRKTAEITKRPGIPSGWKICAYSCKSSGGNTHPRYVPVEFSCPNTAPWAPGVDPMFGMPKPRTPGSPYVNPWSHFKP